MTIKLTDELIELERVSEAARLKAVSEPYSVETWAPWMEAAEKVQAAITAHAEATGQNRFEVGAEAKLAALHPEEYALKVEKAKK